MAGFAESFGEFVGVDVFVGFDCLDEYLGAFVVAVHIVQEHNKDYFLQQGEQRR